MINFYNQEREHKAKELSYDIQKDETKIVWTDMFKNSLLNNEVFRWVLIIIFFEILIPPEPFMRDAPHFFYRKYNKNLL